MPTKSAGRVSIRVLPDSSRFREDLKKSLERIEKTTKVTIPAELVVTRESIRRLKEQLRDIEARIKVEPFVTEEQLHELKRKIEGVDPHVQANLDALNAQRRLAVLSRDRQVSIFVKVNKASAVAAAQTLAALSGTRLATNLFEDFFDNIKNLDKNAPKIGLISTGIAGLSAVVLAAVSNFGGLLGSFAQLGQSTILLPALMSGAAISIGVLIAAFKDMKTVLGDLAPGFHQLQDTISSKFWSEAAAPIRHMVNTLMPQLKESLGDVAKSWGNLFGNMAREIEANVTPKELAFMMGNLSRAIDIASGAMKPLVHAFNTLGSFGSTYLPRLSDWLVDISKKFDNFITKAEKDGKLKEWADEGIDAIKDLGKVIYETGRVFSALNMAAKRAGGSNFEELAGGLKKLSDVMRTEGFQKSFETIFAGAHKAVAGLLQGIENLGPGLAKFAPTLNTVFSEVGKIFESVGRSLSTLFSNPRLNQGIKDFFSGFLTFIDTLGPAMGPLGTIIGTLATAVGSLVAQAGPLVTDILTKLAPMFEEVWKAVQPLIPDLVDLAGTLVKELAPVLLTLIKEVLPPVIQLIKDLTPVLKDLIIAAAPVLIDFFKKLGEALRVMGPYIRDAATWVDGLAKSLDKFPLALFQGSTGDKKGMIFTLAQMAIDHPEVPVFFKILGEALGGVFTKIEGAAKAVTTLGDFVGTLQKLASVQGLTTILITLNEIFGITEKWDTFWSGIQATVDRIWASLPIPVQAGLNILSTAISVFTAGSKINWDTFWGSLPGMIPIYLSTANANVGGGVAGIATTLAVFFATNKGNWSNFWLDLVIQAGIGMAQILGRINGGTPPINSTLMSFMINAAIIFTRGWSTIQAGVSPWFGSIAGQVTIGVGIVVARIASMPNQMIAILWGAMYRFEQAGAALIAGFARGITSGTNPVVTAITAVVAEVSKYLPHSPAKKGPLSGRGWTLYGGRSTVDAFAQGMKDRTDSLKRTADGVMSVAQLGGSGLSTSSAVSGVRGSAAMGGGALVHIEGDYYGATPEKVADELDKKVRRANLAAQISKVGK